MDKIDQRTKTRGEVAARYEREREAVVEKLPVAEGMEESVARERVLRKARPPIITYFNFQICPWLAPPERCRSNQVSGIISIVLSSEYETL